MKKLTFNEFKEQLSFCDRQIAIHKEFVETSRESDELQICYYEVIISSLQIKKNKLVNNPSYLEYIRRINSELAQQNR